MKDFIISTMETLLTFAFFVITLGGFLAGGNANRFGDFNILTALIGGVLGFCSAVLFTGVVFTLLRIKELLEEQVEILRKSGVNPIPTGAVTQRLTQQQGLVTLYDNVTGAALGQVSKEAFDSLLAQADGEIGPDENTLYVMADAIEILSEEGVDPTLIGILRSAIASDEGVELRWQVI